MYYDKFIIRPVSVLGLILKHQVNKSLFDLGSYINIYLCKANVCLINFPPSHSYFIAITMIFIVNFHCIS